MPASRASSRARSSTVRSSARSIRIIPRSNSARTRHGVRPCSAATCAARRAADSVTSRSVRHATRDTTPRASHSAAARAGRLGPGDRPGRQLAGRGIPTGPERGVRAQHERAGVVGTAGALDVALRVGPLAARHGRPRELQAQLGVRVAVQRVQVRGAQGQRRAGPPDLGEHGDPLDRDRRVPGVGRGGRREVLLGGAQGPAGGVAAGQPQEQVHRRVRLAGVDVQLRGPRLVVRSGARGEHPRGPAGQRGAFGRQQLREDGVAGERVRPGQGRAVGHQQRLPRRGPQRPQHRRPRWCRVTGASSRQSSSGPSTAAACSTARAGSSSAASRSATSAVSVGGTVASGAASSSSTAKGRPSDRSRRRRGLVVGQRAATSACGGQRGDVPLVEPGERTVAVPGTAAMRRAAGAGVSSRAEQASSTGAASTRRARRGARPARACRRRPSAGPPGGARSRARRAA